MPRGAEQLDELYNQLLDSFDDDGPDLNLISSLPPNDSRKKSARKETSDSDKLLDLYQSYADEAPPDQYSSRAVHPHNTSVPSNPTPLSMNTLALDLPRCAILKGMAHRHSGFTHTNEWNVVARGCVYSKSPSANDFSYDVRILSIVPSATNTSLRHF